MSSMIFQLYSAKKPGQSSGSIPKVNLYRLKAVVLDRAKEYKTVIGYKLQQIR